MNVRIDSIGKMGFALICFFVTLFVFMTLGVTILGFSLWGVVAWCVFMGWFVRLFLVSVPEVTGLLTVNYLTGGLTPYGTGVHFRYPWEQVKIGLYINLRLKTEEVVETYPSMDGPVMEAKWSFQYQPVMERLATYIAVDDSTIREGLREVGSAFLSAEIARINSEQCKREQHKLEEDLRDRFLGQTNDPRNPLNLYGVQIVRAAIADLDFEPTVQAARASQQVSAIILKIAKEIHRQHPKLTDQEAMNKALVIHGKISESLVGVQGEGGNALAALIMAALGGKK